MAGFRSRSRARSKSRTCGVCFWLTWRVMPRAPMRARVALPRKKRSSASSRCSKPKSPGQPTPATPRCGRNKVTDMPINILMPALSPTMEKGNLSKWLKKEGDKVQSGDVIAEIETDKATMEVEAVDEGTLAKILVPEGTQDVPVNDVIAVLASDGEDVKAAGAASPAPKPASTPAAAPKPAPASGPAPVAPAPVPARAAAPPAPNAAVQTAASAPQTNGHG